MITVTKKIVVTHAAQGRRRLVDKPSFIMATPEGRTPRVSKTMAIALHFDALIQAGKLLDMKELAALACVTTSRLTQVMNLLHLAPDIQEDLLFLPRVFQGRDPIHEKRLRFLCQEICFEKQRLLWRQMKARFLSEQ